MVVKWGVYSKRTTQNDRIVWVIIIQKASWKRWDMYWDEKVFRERGTDFHIMRNIFWFSTLLCSLCVSELVIASKNTQEWDRLSQCLQLSGVCKEATRPMKIQCNESYRGGSPVSPMSIWEESQPGDKNNLPWVTTCLVETYR